MSTTPTRLVNDAVLAGLFAAAALTVLVVVVATVLYVGYLASFLPVQP